MKKFFRYTKYYGVTGMLLALGSFDTVIHNYRQVTHQEMR